MRINFNCNMFNRVNGISASCSFEKVDKNCDGVIDKDELNSFIMSSDSTTCTFEDFDTDGDGTISASEYNKVLKELERYAKDNNEDDALSADDYTVSSSSFIQNDQSSIIVVSGTAKSVINQYKEQYRAQLQGKLGEDYTSEMNALFEKFFTKSVEITEKNLMSENQWKNMKFSEILAEFDKVFNEKMVETVEEANNPYLISSETLDIAPSIGPRTKNYLASEINGYKEQYRAQLKEKLGEDYTTDINTLFERFYSLSVGDIVEKFIPNGNFTSETLNTYDIMAEFDKVFNTRMKETIENINNPYAISSATLNIAPSIGPRTKNTLYAELNGYKEQYRTQLKEKLGEDYTSDINTLFERFYSLSVGDIVEKFIPNNNFTSEMLNTYNIMFEFDKVFNTRMQDTIEKVSNPYTISSEVLNTGCSIGHRTKNALYDELKDYKELYRTQLKEKLGEDYTSEFNTLFEKFYASSVGVIVEKFIPNGWISDKALNTYNILAEFDKVFNSQMNEAMDKINDTHSVSSEAMNTFNNKGIHSRMVLFAEINGYKEQYRTQLKEKLGEKYTSNIDAQFNIIYSSSANTIADKLIPDNWLYDKTLSTNEILVEFDRVFNAKMKEVI